LYFVLVLVLGPPVLVLVLGLHVLVLVRAPLVLVLDEIVLATRLLLAKQYMRRSLGKLASPVTPFKVTQGHQK